VTRWPFAAVLVWVLGAACPQSPQNEVQPVSTPARADTNASPQFLNMERLAPVAFSLKARTQVEIRRGATATRLRDEKDVEHLRSTDFRVSVRRGHETPGSAETVESFEAIRVGRDYYTRGSGGPFVHWDDALEEPDQAFSLAVRDANDLLAFLGPCISARVQEAGVEVLGLARPDCAVVSTAGMEAMNAVVREFTGRLEREAGEPTRVTFSARLSVAAGGHPAEVRIEHETVRSNLPEDFLVVAPRDAIASRRERPVRMVVSVLSGLGAAWGPGAPARARGD